MSMTLQEELACSFGDGPAHRPVEESLRLGRRALRRRRIGAAACALAVVAAIGTGYAAGTGPRTTGEVVSDPTPSPSPTKDASPAGERWRKDETVRYSADGELEVRPGVVVHERIENPYGYEPPKLSDALDLTFEGQRIWTIVEVGNGDFTYSGSVPGNGWASFDDYVADQADGATGGADGWPDTLSLTADGRVVPTPGTTVHDRTDDPQLGDSFAEPGTPTGAAVVSVPGDEKSYFVVWRVIDGELDVITTPPSKVTGASFEQLLVYARSQYDSGEGLR